MSRNLELEKEMKEICQHVQDKIGTKDMPDIESKQGGCSGCYYPSKHKVYFRWDVWHKLNLTCKRLLAIYELIHATGWDHKSVYGFMHGSDLISVEIYKLLYGGPDLTFIKNMGKKPVKGD